MNERPQLICVPLEPTFALIALTDVIHFETVVPLEIGSFIDDAVSSTITTSGTSFATAGRVSTQVSPFPAAPVMIDPAAPAAPPPMPVGIGIVPSPPVPAPAAPDSVPPPVPHPIATAATAVSTPHRTDDFTNTR